MSDMIAQGQNLQRKRLLRIAFISVTVLFATGLVVVVEYFSPKPWSDVVAIVLGVIGLVVAACQWLWPLPSDSPPPPSHAELPAPAKQVETGTLVVYTGPDLRGRSISICNDFISPLNIVLASPACSASNVLERVINGRSEFNAIFHDLASGKYTAYMYDGLYIKHAPVTVHPGKTTEIDWR
jgi:hypothetical protein